MEALSISLKGPSIYVSKLKESLSKLLEDLKVIPVDLNPELTNHFATSLNEGQKQIHDFIKSSKCPTVVSFSACPKGSKTAKLSLLLVCKSKDYDWAKSVQESIEEKAGYKDITVPEFLASLIDKRKEYNTLISQLRTNYSVRIIYDEFKRQISVFGFGEGVIEGATQIEEFIRHNKSLVIPLSVPLDQLLSKALKKRSQNLDKILGECHASLSYTFSDPDETEILVSSKTSIKDDWKPRCKSALTNYIKKFQVIQLTFTRDAKKEIITFLENKDKSTKYPFAFDLEEADLLVQIVGEATFIADVQREFKEIDHSFSTAKKSLRLLQVQQTYIRQVSLENIKTRFPELAIEFSDNFQCLCLKGFQRNIRHFEEWFAQNYKISSITVASDTLLVEFLNHEYGKNFLNVFLESKKVSKVAILESNSSQLDLLFDSAVMSADIETVVYELRLKLKIKTISLPESLKRPKQETKLKISNFYKQIEKDFNILCSYTHGNTQIILGGTVEDVNLAGTKLTEFFEEESTCVKDLQLTSLQWTLIKGDYRCMQEIKQWLCEVKPLENGSQIVQMSLKLKGEEFAVTKAFQVLLEIKESLITDSVIVYAPGACAYFSKENTKTTVLPGIEKTYKVCIEMFAFEYDESEVDIKGADKSTAREFCRVSTQFGQSDKIVTFKVYIGDLTEFKADVLVNPANGQLRHAGGLAAAIVKKGGQEIQDDCNRFIQGNVLDLDEGEVYFSHKVGCLPCKAIVHAVGPKISTPISRS